MKLQIMSALIFLFFMMLFSFVKLQITPTKYGTQISFGHKAHPVTLPVATNPVIATGECYSLESEQKDEKSRALVAGFDVIHDQQLQQLETIIEELNSSIKHEHPVTVELSKNLP